jgi:uncharacterized protein
VRVLLDTNLFISYLLFPHGRNNPTLIVEAAVVGVFTLLLAGEGLAELTRRVSTKPYLIRRITPSDLAAALATLEAAGEIIPPIAAAVPATSRDRKDDYLLAYAVVGQADYLVTGDRDLLTLGEVEGVRIVSPATFMALLATDGQVG